MDRLEQDPASNTSERGFKAEDIAARHLQGIGFTIVERNFYCKGGELDIIAIRDGEMTFVEVRSRQSEESLNPLFTISEKKQKSIKKAAQIYVMKNSVKLPFRFDFAIVTMTPTPVVDIVENALFEFPFR
jgi:putative endonuclease